MFNKYPISLYILELECFFLDFFFIIKMPKSLMKQNHPQKKLELKQFAISHLARTDRRVLYGDIEWTFHIGRGSPQQ